MTIQQIIDTELAKIQEERKTRQRSGKFSPSMLGRCYRAQYWNRKNKPITNPPDARTLRVFKAGQLFHDFVQQYIPDANKEVKIEDDNFLGFADIVGKETVYDIKSTHSRGFFYMNKAGYDVNKEKLTNILQCALYAKLLDKPKFSLVFISKDDLSMNQYGFFTEKWELPLKNEIDTLLSFWSKDILPPCKPRAYNGKEGKYCNFQLACLSLGWDCIKQSGKECK